MGVKKEKEHTTDGRLRNDQEVSSCKRWHLEKASKDELFSEGTDGVRSLPTDGTV